MGKYEKRAALNFRNSNVVNFILFFKTSKKLLTGVSLDFMFFFFLKKEQQFKSSLQQHFYFILILRLSPPPCVKSLHIISQRKIRMEGTIVNPGNSVGICR